MLLIAAAVVVVVAAAAVVAVVSTLLPSLFPPLSTRMPSTTGKSGRFSKPLPLLLLLLLEMLSELVLM